MAGAVLGGLAGAGACLAVSRLPVLRRPGLDARLAPYLRDAPKPSRLLSAERALTPFPTLERILRPVLGDGIRMLDHVFGGAGGIRRRLLQAGRGMTIEEFRAEQVLCGAVGLVVGLVVSLALLADDPTRPAVALFVFTLASAVAGIFVRDRMLTREVRQREVRMLAEFPTIAELLALSVAAGEGPVGALERVTRSSRGEVAKELDFVLAQARAGSGLVNALEQVAARTSLPPLARFADGVAVAVERGTPLADVLRAQAVDVREAGKRALLEVGGKKEIAMMIPVVFLILPVTVLFALFPGFFALNLSVM